MKETPIIMSGDHPRKILDGTKTMTRRVIKPQPAGASYWTGYRMLPEQPFAFYPNTKDAEPKLLKCPYGQVGDRLWVRETWRLEMHSGCWDVGFKNTVWKEDVGVNPYLAKYEHLKDKAWIWRPSIFMPRWASRITLEITEEKVARTQDLTLAEAIAEGYNSVKEANSEFLKLAHLPEDANPWDWYISFKVI